MAAGSSSSVEDSKPSTRGPHRFQVGNRLGFQPGQSGCPGGKGKAVAAVERLALSLAPDAVRELERIMRSSPSDRARIAACEAILNRGLGRAPLRIVDKDGEDRPIITAIENVVVKPDGTRIVLDPGPRRDASSPIDPTAQNVTVLDAVAS